MNLSTFLTKSVTAVQEGRGLKAAVDFYHTTLYSYGYRYRSWQFDRRFGVNTSAKDLDLKKRKPLIQAINSSNAEQLTTFGPADPKLMNGVLEALPIRYEDYTFVDLGSGTGRVLLMASEFPFRKIIGVEFCPPLRDKALENLRQYRSSSQKCRNFEILLLDARLFAVPDEPVVVFLCHPFRVESLFREVLENVKQSLVTAPRATLPHLLHSYVLHHDPGLQVLGEDSQSAALRHLSKYPLDRSNGTRCRCVA